MRQNLNSKNLLNNQIYVFLNKQKSGKFYSGIKLEQISESLQEHFHHITQINCINFNPINSTHTERDFPSHYPQMLIQQIFIWIKDNQHISNKDRERKKNQRNSFYRRSTLQKEIVQQTQQKNPPSFFVCELCWCSSQTGNNRGNLRKRKRMKCREHKFCSLSSKANLDYNFQST